jgi:hypothetical protein
MTGALTPPLGTRSATVMKITVLIEPCAYDHIVCRPCERPSGDMLMRVVHEPCPNFGLIRSARHPEMPLFFFHIKENGAFFTMRRVRIISIWTLRARKRSRASGRSSAMRS